GDPASASPHAQPHYEMDVFDRLSDFPRGAKVTGAGWPFFQGGLARLIRSLINFYLDEARDNGYEELMAPLVVNEASARATGQLPDKEGQMYVIPREGFYMIPTSEVPVTNFYRDEILDEAELPLLRACYTPCFRREAGSHGKDVRGLNRTHQFDKVELVKWVKPEESYNELESLRAHAEDLLQKLNLPYRVLLMCTGDLGFTQSKKYDLEVWAAGQERWLEVSSCSNFEAFQARRANIRFRPPGGKPIHVHTLNGSGLAVPRVLAAILENNLQEDGRVKIPDVLTKYVGKDYLE
ncbi:MAG: serine--tRNA ligase, partial [Verrucomicrobia bacterium]|nr:serine--tRNA ligase [Verrucomicrobiota bacterium]